MLVWFYWIWPKYSTVQLCRRLVPSKHNFITRNMDGLLIVTMCKKNTLKVFDMFDVFWHMGIFLDVSFSQSNHSWLLLHMYIFLLMRVNSNLPSAIFLICSSAFPPTEERKTYIIYLTPWHHLEQQPAQAATDLHLIEVKSLPKADTPFIPNTGSFLLYFPEACCHFKGVYGMICRRKCCRPPL